MAELNIRLDLRPGPGLARWGFVGLLLTLLAPDLATETANLTTYYPAPSGVYSQLLTAGNTYLARNNGNVGIGTMSPSAKLEVANGIRFKSDCGELSSLGGNPAIGSRGGSPLVFAINGAEQARIDTSGNFGLGTPSPASKLEINGNLAFTSPDNYAKICQEAASCPANYKPVMIGGASKIYGESYSNTTLGGSFTSGSTSVSTLRCCKVGP